MGSVGVGGLRARGASRAGEPRSPLHIESLDDLVEELHRSASDARGEGFPLMARRLDECGLALRDLHDGSERAVVARSRECLQLWRALAEW